MSEFKMTPFELRMLLHYATSPSAFETRADPGLVSESVTRLRAAGLIVQSPNASMWEATEKGRAWLEMACATPLPVQRWVRP